MIIVVGGIKGGSGKTTIATNLAVMRSMGKKVLLVDADEQKSAWDWAQQRDSLVTDSLNSKFSTVCMSGKAIYSNLQRLKEDYDDIIVDTGGRDTTSQRSALSIADKLILPFKPSSIDIWTLIPIKNILNEWCKCWCTFVRCTHQGTREATRSESGLGSATKNRLRLNSRYKINTNN